MARKNPALVVFNPRWHKIASHVQAICYVHAKDGQCYVHGFGNHDPSEAELRKGVLNMNNLKMHTDVEAFFNDDMTEVRIRHKSGKPLTDLFPD
jgi:hypothetical protein